MAKAKKFGAFSGVFTPSILTILGVIMFLRLPWIVGQAGLWATIGIILVAHIISFSTGLSVASIATDKKVESGGSYYIISRSLGLPIGGTLGLALFIGLSFSISLYLIGFAEVLLGALGIESTLNNIRLTGALALLGLTIITFISTSLAIKSQYIILTALVLAIISVLFGNHSYSPAAPLFSSMSGSLPWITLFAIFFPAVTGFEAGVSMSGDLKNPKKDIPGGTIAAILVGLITYIGLAFFFSYYVERDLLVNDSSVLLKISWIPQLVIAGILAATFSSALGSILGAPRILQATSNDKITPSFLGKGFGASNEPRNALLFTFVIALTGILIGELNVIARIVTIFFIITYGFLNITYTIESWAGADFRPSFRIPWIISILGAITCIIIMIQLDIVAMIGASILLFGLFLFLKKKELTLQTGDTWNSVWASLVKSGLRKLVIGSRQPRNWRPNIILFSGGAKNRPYLIDAAKALVGKLGIFTNFELVENKEEKTLFSKSQQIIEEESMSHKGVFTRRHVCRDIYEGMESIAKIYGFSGFEPNTILMGWPRNSKNPEAFLRLARKIKKLEYNQVYLDFDKTREFGKMKQIDIWWSGKGRNISFAIALIRFITSTNKWRSAKIRILIINNQSNLTEKYYELLEQILENTRIYAEIKVINNSVEKLPAKDIMQSESIKTDLSIIELDEKGDNFITQINQLTEHLPSALIISASSNFDEHSVVSRPVNDKLVMPEESEKPHFNIVQNLKLTDREIIANEVFKISKNLESVTAEYYQKGFEPILSQFIDYNQELLSIVEKTTDQLYNAANADDPDTRKNDFLRVLNDFSFKAQNSLKNLKKEIIVQQKQILHIQTEKYIAQTDRYLLELPQYLRVKYNWKEFSSLKADSFITTVFKTGKLLKARVTGKQATYIIKVGRTARYFLYHKRMVLINNLLLEFALQSFENKIVMRNILSDINELTEKGKIKSSDKEKIKNIIMMEKDRFRASLSLAADSNRNFFHNIGNTLENELLSDLQNFNNLLARPGSNFLSKPFTKAIKKDHLILEEIRQFPDIWLQNTNLFVNKMYLDFLLQSLKNRIEVKIRKHIAEYHLQLASSLLNPLADIREQLQTLLKEGTFSKKPDRKLIKIPAPDEYYNKLFDEITALFSDLPIVISIVGEDLTHGLENKKFEEAQEIVVSVRKTVEFSIASELIDTVKKHAVETSLNLTKSLTRVKDYIRLINFNLVDETDDDQLSSEEKLKLTKDFIEKINQEEALVIHTITTFETSFFTGLKNTFAPLSSSVIAKTSGSIQKKFAQTRNQKVLDKISDWQKDVFAKFQNQVVGLIYSKSESILWMGKMEKPASHTSLANEDVFSWLDVYSPKQNIIQKLPFYYSKLFSGQSGIGDDFWVGMKDEILLSDKAIERFRNGQAGCLIISGVRNSGKTSLSKYVARKHFSTDQIHNIRAPRECTADVDLLENSLLKSLSSSHQNIETAFQELQKPIVCIVNDLELWWERKKGGAEVVERLIFLVKKYHKKVFFIINVNTHSLRLINRLTGLQSWSLGYVSCSGFDARELHDMILLRHQAGGLKFILDKKHEDNLTAWNYARLFNRYFDISNGNPGQAINLWMASIVKVNGKTIHMQKPPSRKADFLDKLNMDQLFLLIQFIYHLRLSLNKLAQAIQTEEEKLENQILILWQSGILVEKFPGIYAINSALQQPLENKFKEMKLL